MNGKGLCLMLTLAVGCLQRMSNWRQAYSLPQRRGQGYCEERAEGQLLPREAGAPQGALRADHGVLPEPLSGHRPRGCHRPQRLCLCVGVSAQGATKAPRPLLPGKTGAGSPAAGGSGWMARHGSSWPAVSIVAPVCGGCRRGLAELLAAAAARAVARAMQAGPGHGPCPCSTALCLLATHWGTVVWGCRAVPGRSGCSVLPRFAGNTWVHQARPLPSW